LSNPKISIIITAYNRKQFLSQAIESIAKQEIDGSEFEVIVVSNFELDGHLFNNKIAISSIVMDGTIGEFLYAGVKASKSDSIAFLDDDDIFKPGKLKTVIDIFEENPDLCYYHNAPEYLDINLNHTDYVRLVERKSSLYYHNDLNFDIISSPKSIKSAIYINGDFNLSCISIRRKAYLRYLALLKQIKGCTDGFFFWSGVFSGGKMKIDHRKFTGYRVHNLNTSGSLNYNRKREGVNREIYTYDMLLNFTGQLNIPSNIIIYIKKWITLYKLEYLLIKYIFDHVPRVTIIRNLIDLLTIGTEYSNTIKYRIIVLSIVRLLSAKLARSIYKIIR
jgi:glycosyltransferase involved in cell wall biosynthesis